MALARAIATALAIAVNNNLSSNTPAPTPIGAEGAVSRAGFCGAASTGASHGASFAARSASQPLGAEFCAQLPALAGGSSTPHNFSSAPASFGAEGAASRTGFCGAAPAGAYSQAPTPASLEAPAANLAATRSVAPISHHNCLL
jgi:hypothetical protein